MAKGKGYKRRRALRLWEEQNGLCWVCGYPMLKPPESRTGNPNRWEATIDHLEPQTSDGMPRDVRAAHKGCNNFRHHLEITDPKLDLLRSKVAGKFKNENWLLATFGKEAMAQWKNVGALKGCGSIQN